MRIECERLPSGGRLEWNIGTGRGDKDEALRCVLGAGRGCVLYGQKLPAAVLVPLRGRLQVSDGDSTQILATRQLLVVEAGHWTQATGRGNALWLAVSARTPSWRRLLDSIDADAIADPILLPATHPADNVIRRAALELVRHSSERRDARGSIAASVFATSMLDLQSEFDPFIDRCPGRTLTQRRSVFLRLQRVRNFIVTRCHIDIDIAGLARMASYSPCHFIRAFSTVFGETPHAVLVDRRLDRAHRMIHDSSMAITEIARASGFENRCAFARSFKRRFGVTATDLRSATRVPQEAAA